jgi:hypothetical protein
MDFIASEADANRPMTLEIQDKIWSYLDHYASLDKTQTKKEKPPYATKKYSLRWNLPSRTGRYMDNNPGTLDLNIRNPKKKLSKSSISTPNRPLEKAEYKTKPRRMLDIKKIEIK